MKIVGYRNHSSPSPKEKEENLVSQFPLCPNKVSTETRKKKITYSAIKNVGARNVSKEDEEDYK